VTFYAEVGNKLLYCVVDIVADYRRKTTDLMQLQHWKVQHSSYSV